MIVSRSSSTCMRCGRTLEGEGVAGHQDSESSLGVDEYILCVDSTLSRKLDTNQKNFSPTPSLVLCKIFWVPFQSALYYFRMAWVCVWPPLQRVERGKNDYLSNWFKRSYTRVYVCVWCVWSCEVLLAIWVYFGRIFSVWQNWNRHLLSVFGTGTHSDAFVTKKTGTYSICSSTVSSVLPAKIDRPSTFSVDWCCFYFFVRNSPVALLGALYARTQCLWVATGHASPGYS